MRSYSINLKNPSIVETHKEYLLVNFGVHKSIRTKVVLARVWIGYYRSWQAQSSIVAGIFRGDPSPPGYG
jgi:hypothetical protein